MSDESRSPAPTQTNVIPFPGSTGSQVLDEADPAEIRRRGIGGSDIGALAGLDPYRNAFDVFTEKVLGIQKIENEAMRLGKLLEPIIGQEYARREGVEITRRKPNPFIRDEQRTWIRGSIDFFVVKQPVGVDCKMTNVRQAHRWGDTDTDQIPEEIIAQAQWYLYILRRQVMRWDIPVLLGSEIRIYRVAPNDELQGLLVEIGEKFWRDHVLTKTPPDMDASVNAKRMLERIFPRGHGEIRQATPEEEELVSAYREAREVLAAHEERAYYYQNLLRQAIAEDDGLKGSFGELTWRRTRDGTRTDWVAVVTAMRNELGLRKMADLLKLLDETQERYTQPVEGVRRFLPRFTALAKAEP